MLAKCPYTVPLLGQQAHHLSEKGIEVEIIEENAAAEYSDWEVMGFSRVFQPSPQQSIFISFFDKSLTSHEIILHPNFLTIDAQ